MPVEAVYDEDVEPMALLQAIMELNRGHSESKVKSERVGAAWARKRREADKRVVTRRVPGWVKYQDGRLVLDEEAAATMRRVYQMARDGLGTAAIARVLNKDRVPVLGRTTLKGRPVEWGATVVHHLLTTKTALGEYQPRSGRGSLKTRRASGEPVAGYYPAVVDADTFYAVQAALKQRANSGRGRRGTRLNLFSGLLKDAHDGGSLTYKTDRTKPTVLIPIGARQGRGVVWTSFPAKVFEEAMLWKMHEIQARDLFPNGDAVHKVEALAGRLAEVDRLIQLWTAKMDNPDLVDTVAAKLAEYRTKQKALAEQLASAQREASSPPSEAWGEFRSLAEVLAKAHDPDAARQRMRAALRRVVEGVWCVFVGHGGVRLAYVQIFFTGGRSREYLIYHRQAQGGFVGNRPARWSVASWSDKWGTGDRFSLKDPRRAQQVRLALSPAEPGGRPSRVPEEYREEYEAHVKAEWDIPTVTDLVACMERAATPTGGSPDPDVIGPLVMEVLGKAGSVLKARPPRVE
jgi:Recombinase